MLETKHKILLLDVGNTSISGGIYVGGQISQILSMPTENIARLLQIYQGVYDEVVIASVVPSLDAEFLRFCEKPVTFLTANNIPEISLEQFLKPEEVGADRLVTALAAYHLVQGPVLIVDAGTAVTFCIVSESGAYLGGAIVPGIETSMKALSTFTEKIPSMVFSVPSSIVGQTTEAAVLAGTYYGYQALINGLIDGYKQKYPRIKVLGTGQGLLCLQDQLDLDDYIPNLVLIGLGCVVKHLVKDKASMLR